MKHPSFLLLLFFLLETGSTTAQDLVKGIVSDEDGTPLVGVTVYERGTNIGTMTAWDGYYALRCSRADATLVFAYTGYATLEIPLDGRSEINVQLREGLLIEGLEIVGSRALNRSVTNSLVPIDVLDVRQITATQGQLDVNQMLQYAAPSFNANRQTGAKFGIADVGCLLFAIGVGAFIVARRASGSPLFPLHDPRVPEAMRVENL